MQVTGVEPILYYILSILEAANITDDFDQANALVGLAAFTSVCSIIGGQLIDRQGRRQLLLMSLAGVGVANLMIAGYFVAIEAWGPTLAILGVGSYFGWYGYDRNPVNYVLPPELFPTSVRAKVMSVFSIIHGGMASLLLSTFLTVADIITWPGYFCFFAGCSFLDFVLYYVFLPETKGMVPEDIMLLFPEQTGDFSVLHAQEEVMERDHSESHHDISETVFFPSLASSRGSRQCRQSSHPKSETEPA